MDEFKNDVFISYSRKDKEFARLLEQALEGYHPFKDLPVPQRNLIVFRDEADFTGVEYNTALHRHLESSSTLIVICSPHSRQSTFVDGEIRQFAALRGRENIIPVLLSGIPNNEARPGQEDEKAFPGALMEVMEMPLAVNYLGFDVRKDKISKGVFYGSWYTVLANIYHVSRSEIEERDKKRQARTRRIRAAIVSGVMAALMALSAWALYSRNLAVKQSRIALSRQLAAQALPLAKTAPDLALLVALEAITSASTGDAIDALLGTLLENPHLDAILTTGDKLAKQIAFNHDGSVLAVLGTSGVTLWDMQMRKPLAVPLNGTGFNSDLGVSADGKVLAVRRSGREEGISFWDFATGRSLGPGVSYIEAEREVARLGVVFRGAFADHRLKKEFTSRPPCEGDIERTEASLNNALIAVGCYDGNIVFFDVNSSRWRQDYSANVPHREPAISLAFSPDGGTFVSGGYDGSIVLWDLITWRQMQPLVWQGTAEVTDLLFSSDGSALASAHGDGTVRLWNMKIRKRLALPLAGVDDLHEFSDQPEMLPMSIPILWSDGARRRLAFESVPLKNGIPFAEIGADGRLMQPFAMVEDNAFVLAVDVHTRRYAYSTVIGMGIKGIDDETRVELIVPGAVSMENAAFSPDGMHVAGISREGDILLWEIGGLRLVWRMEQAHKRSSALSQWILGFSPDGRWLATGGDDRRLIIWEAYTGEKVTELGDSMGGITSLAFRPDNKRLAVGQNDGKIALIDTATWKVSGLPLSLPGPRSRNGPFHERENSITSLSFSQDSKRMAAGVGDGSLVLWRVDEGDWRGRDLTGHRDRILHTAFSADGGRLVSVDGSEAVAWDVEVNSWKKRACAIANRNLTVAEWKQYFGDIPYASTCSDLPSATRSSLSSSTH